LACCGLSLEIVGFGETVTGGQTVSVSLGPAGKIQVVQPTVTLIRSGAVFQDFTGAVTIQYKVRTSLGSGTASLSATAAGEFTPASGPRIANGDLRYTCSGATLGTACSGAQTVRTSVQTPVVNVGPGACTGPGCAGADPNSVILNLSTTNSPAFETGQYTSILTFTFSSM
jgi:hypothetical protein